MKHFEIINSFLKKNEKKFVNTLTKQKCLVLKRDKIVAEYLGIAQPETVWLIRRLLEKVEWLKLKIDKNVNEEASSSINKREEEIR
ncbi:14250_t:CDS:1, partial [Gigaspora margarita]